MPNENNRGSAATLSPDEARQQYINSLRQEHEAALAEINKANEQMETLEEQIVQRRDRVRETMNELRQLGVEIDVPEGFGRSRGRAAGTRGGGRRMAGRGGRQRVRPENDNKLDDTILSVMGGKRLGTEFTVPEIMEGVQSSGYKSSSSNFRVIINQTLIRLKSQRAVKRVRRGIYVLTERGKAGGSAGAARRSRGGGQRGGAGGGNGNGGGGEAQ